MTERELLRVRGAAAGPALVVVCAIHGNEPAGVDAVRRMAPRVLALQGRMRGTMTAFVGNVAAYDRGVRYVDCDLNRLWTPAHLAALAKGGLHASAVSEERELAELHPCVDAARRGTSDTLLVDLHSTSGDGAPFLVVTDTPASRAFAGHFPLTSVVRLIEKLPGTMTDALAPWFPVSIVLESGRHGTEIAVARSEALLWVALVRAGMIDAADAPDLAPHLHVLSQGRGDLPPTMEVIYRHAIREEDGFRMRPGYRHFQEVVEGEIVADDLRGEVRAPRAGYMLMPLYQGLGDDGFFLAS